MEEHQTALGFQSLVIWNGFQDQRVGEVSDDQKDQQNREKK